MKIDIGKYQIELSEESNYKKDSMDNTFKFENHYFDEEEYPFSTQIGILQSVGTTQIEVYVMPNAKR